MATTGESQLTLPLSRVNIHFSARTDVGTVRTANEDSLLTQPPVFLIADGMGGHARGDAASQTVVRVFDEHIAADEPSTPERILDAIHSSNDAVRDLSADDDFGTAVAGTTLTGVALVDAGDGLGYFWMAFNVGDSRLYRWDGRSIHQISVDHSAVQQLVDAGLISANDAEHHPERNVITRAIGADEFVDPDVWMLPVDAHDAFLLCSDGLTKELDARDINRILAASMATPESRGTIADSLVDAALVQGASDNVSVIFIDSFSTAPTDAPPSG